jgi:hypothetical protein
MYKKYLQSGSWIALALSLLACAAVFHAGSSILADASLKSEQASEAAQSTAKAAYTQRLRSLASDTEADRTALDNLVGEDIASLATTIESAGTSAGIAAHVTQATPEGAPADLPGGTLQAISMVVEGEGSFARVMHALSLYETLPLPAAIEQFDIERTGETSAWHLTLHLRVFTSAPVTS